MIDHIKPIERTGETFVLPEKFVTGFYGAMAGMAFTSIIFLIMSELFIRS